MVMGWGGDGVGGGGLVVRHLAALFELAGRVTRLNLREVAQRDRRRRPWQERRPTRATRLRRGADRATALAREIDVPKVDLALEETRQRLTSVG